MGINTQFNAKGLFKLFAGASLALLITSPSFAGTVAITYEDAGTSTDGAGAHNMTIDGVSSHAMIITTKSNPSAGVIYTATINAYDDVKNSAGNGKKLKKAKNAKKPDIEKYSQIGGLFSILSLGEAIDESTKQLNAAINQAVWKIMGKKDTLSVSAQSYYNDATDGRYIGYDWSKSMTLYSAGKFDFFASAAPIATPIPSAIFLFGSVIIGLFGIVRRKSDLQIGTR
jgi:hypothetical protein